MLKERLTNPNILNLCTLVLGYRRYLILSGWRWAKSNPTAISGLLQPQSAIRFLSPVPRSTYHFQLNQLHHSKQVTFRRVLIRYWRLICIIRKYKSRDSKTGRLSLYGILVVPTVLDCWFSEDIKVRLLSALRLQSI